MQIDCTSGSGLCVCVCVCVCISICSALCPLSRALPPHPCRGRTIYGIACPSKVGRYSGIHIIIIRSLRKQGTYLPSLPFYPVRPRDNLRLSSCGGRLAPGSLVHPFAIVCAGCLLVHRSPPGLSRTCTRYCETSQRQGHACGSSLQGVPGVTSAHLHDSTGRPLGPGPQTHSFLPSPVFAARPAGWPDLTDRRRLFVCIIVLAHATRNSVTPGPSTPYQPASLRAACHPHTNPGLRVVTVHTTIQQYLSLPRVRLPSSGALNLGAPSLVPPACCAPMVVVHPV